MLLPAKNDNLIRNNGRLYRRNAVILKNVPIISSLNPLKLERMRCVEYAAVFARLACTFLPKAPPSLLYLLF